MKKFILFLILSFSILCGFAKDRYVIKGYVFKTQIANNQWNRWSDTIPLEGNLTVYDNYDYAIVGMPDTSIVYSKYRFMDSWITSIDGTRVTICKYKDQLGEKCTITYRIPKKQVIFEFPDKKIVYYLK